jgi:hypothetical protein
MLVSFRRLLVFASGIVLCVGAPLVGAQSQERALPRNARASYDARGWECADGFVRRKASCVSGATATDAEIRQHLIDQSIAGYSGRCPCPYFVDRAGRSCGQRSAYSRPGGESPKCYPRDVTADEVLAFRRSAPGTTTPKDSVVPPNVVQ